MTPRKQKTIFGFNFDQIKPRIQNNQFCLDSGTGYRNFDILSNNSDCLIIKPTGKLTLKGKKGNNKLLSLVK